MELSLPENKGLWQSKYLNWLLILLILLVYGLGLSVEIMEVDAAQYASISREMMETGHWLQVHNRHSDYLDKPPLLFWLSAFSLKLFGISCRAYKLPSVIFSFIGFYAVYRLGKLLYNKNTGILAALILATTQAWFMFNNDVRTDTFLASSAILAIWLLQEYRQSKKWLYLFAGFTAIAMAMLAKGPIGLMVPVIAIGSDILLKRDWKSLFDWRWVIGIAFTFLLLLPMLAGLYLQFDLHPEKITNGVQGESGLRFYFWTQSFGRITGQNVWHNDDSPSLFFVHTFLWSFAPWSVLFLPAFFKKTALLFKRRFRLIPPEEGLTVCGFLLPFIVLSFSHYKLPHYIFVTYPLAALLLAEYLISIKGKTLTIYGNIQAGILVLVWAAVCLIIFYLFPANYWIISFVLTGLALSIYFWLRNEKLKRLIFLTAFTAIAANFVMNAWFYPTLLKYQSPSQVAHYLQKSEVSKEHVVSYMQNSYILDYYLGVTDAYYDQKKLDSAVAAKKELWIYTDEPGIQSIPREMLAGADIRAFRHFQVALLNIGFINPKTRQSSLTKHYLIHLRAK